MKTATIVLAVVLTACSPAEKKTSSAEAERQLRLAASEVVKIEHQLASEKSPGMVSLLTEQLRDAKDRLANLSREHSDKVNADAIISGEQHDARMAILKESIQTRKDDESRHQDAAGGRLEAAREAAQRKNEGTAN